jgi:hypothetical protein
MGRFHVCYGMGRKWYRYVKHLGKEFGVRVCVCSLVGMKPKADCYVHGFLLVMRYCGHCLPEATLTTGRTAGELYSQIASLRRNACRIVCVCAIRLFPCATKVRVVPSNTPYSLISVFAHRIEKFGIAHVITQGHSRAYSCLYR